MSILRRISNVFAVGAAVWAIAAALYFLAFAQVSYSGITVSGLQGQAPVTTEFSGHEPWLASAEPMGITFLLSFSVVMALGARLAWHGKLWGTIAFALVTLLASYISGFSIGLFYLPGALALSLCAALLGFGRLRRTAT
jgi:hypothetical protein